jgi:hypothetical protein
VKSTFLALFLLLLLPVVGQGAIVASYPFTSDFASIDADPRTTAGDFLSQATGTFAFEFGVLGTPVGANSQTAAWSARAERDATASWFVFTLALAPGTSQVSFSSLDFTAYVFHTLGGTTAFNYNLYWDVDGFASPIASATGPSISGAPNTSDNASQTLSFDLSGLPAQATDLTFRLDPVFAPGSGTNGGGNVATSQRGGAVDDVVLNATATAAGVPLPPTALLLAVGGLALAARDGIGRRPRR